MLEFGQAGRKHLRGLQRIAQRNVLAVDTAHACHHPISALIMREIRLTRNLFR
jgi:hypothetical protein